jgi:hypothetical protein
VVIIVEDGNEFEAGAERFEELTQHPASQPRCRGVRRTWHMTSEQSVLTGLPKVLVVQVNRERHHPLRPFVPLAAALTVPLAHTLKRVRSEASVIRDPDVVEVSRQQVGCLASGYN